MAAANAGTGPQDDAKLHKLCRDGKLDRIKRFVKTMEEGSLVEKLASRKGVFGYTPLHEAVASGKTEVLLYLLEGLLSKEDTPVNCKANSGYTPLHLAASSGHEGCVKVLIDKGADISVTDEYGKTPKQTAELSSKLRIVQLLISEEIIKEVESNGNKVGELLRQAKSLKPECIDRALIAATRNDNDVNISKLIVKATTSTIVEQCLRIAKEEKKARSRASLLLIRAALTGNRAIVLTLFDDEDKKPEREFPPEHIDEGLKDVRRSLKFTDENSPPKVSTVVSLDLARKYGHIHVQEELLMRTDVDEKNGKVHWDGLRLVDVQPQWLRRIPWVKELRLAHNGLKRIPSEMAILGQVTEIDLRRNDLSDIPKCLLELPQLAKLNLSFNSLSTIPDVPEWSSYLKELDLSSNQLYSLPDRIIAVALEKLYISRNRFRIVPLSICSLANLTHLDLSHNPDILNLPEEMGKLKNVQHLYLEGLKDLNDPPKSMHKEPNLCMIYLKEKLRGVKEFYRMKLMLVGCANRGKTTLVARLQGKDVGNESTVGVDISEWSLKLTFTGKNFHFSIWDFGGQEEYYATHQCFLSQKSLYLLLFNLTHGEQGVQELIPWLNNVATRAPQSCVIIVGTHLDELRELERQALPDLLSKVKGITYPYRKSLQFCEEVIPVSLKKHRLENIDRLKEVVYNQAANYQIEKGNVKVNIMGQKIPTNYHTLDRQLRSVQKDVRRGNRNPIMHVDEFKAMIKRLSLEYISDEEEIRTAVLFLTEVGSLLHFDDRGHNLHELYFIDPRWLCDMMAKVVTIKERNPFIKHGILHNNDIPKIFKDSRFPWQYFEQYLALLDRFEIALPLNNQQVLVPSMLPREKPDGLFFNHQHLLYIRCIEFEAATTPPGFWSRLLSRMMHSVSRVRHALNNTIPYVSPSTPPPLQNREEAPVPTSRQPFSFLRSNPFRRSVIQQPQVTCGAPDKFPNYPTSLPLHSSFPDIQTVRLKYWRTGLYYHDPEVTFCIESLAEPTSLRKDGVLITASAHHVGKNLVCQLLDLITSLVTQWYPGIKSLIQKVRCPKCLEQGYEDPFEFEVEQCQVAVERRKTKIKCHSRSHEVPLRDVVPDLLLQDINPRFLLSPEDIEYKETDKLGEGSFGAVYTGKCKGHSVAIKKLLPKNKAFDMLSSDLRFEAKLLQRLYHPCLVSIVGVCTHPEMLALVLEMAPLQSVNTQKMQIERLTVFRIATEVAAALRFLHTNGIIFRDLKDSNVLLWTTDPNSLCHCKVTDFGIATPFHPGGARGIGGTRGFTAPEVLFFGKYKDQTVYDHRADIFSFAMFLYQLITCRNPYHDLEPIKRSVAISHGERPKLLDAHQAHTSYHYLTKIMRDCWEDNPDKRPSTEYIIKKLCLSQTQSVRRIHPVRSNRNSTVRNSAPVTDFSNVHGFNQLPHSELWVSSLAYKDNIIGTEILVINTHRLFKDYTIFLREKYVQCMAHSGQFMWMGTRTDTDGSIEIYNARTRDLVHSIRMRGSSVSCVTTSHDAVYMGTMEGYCFRFSTDIKEVKTTAKPRHKHIADQVVTSIVYVPQRELLWLSVGRSIRIIQAENLSRVGEIHRERDTSIGQLSITMDHTRVYSVHLGGVIISEWDIESRAHVADVSIEQHMNRIANPISKQDMAITAMTCAVDTVWVGTASGHILVFYHDELLMWHHPYTEYIRFLTRVPSIKPETSNKESEHRFNKCIIASEGKCYQQLVEGLEVKYNDKHDRSQTVGTVVYWEAYNAQTTKQMHLIEKSAPDHLDDYDRVLKLIQDGGFIDGTNVSSLCHKEEDTRVSYSNPRDQDDVEPEEIESGIGTLQAQASVENHKLTSAFTNYFEKSTDLSPESPHLFEESHTSPL